ncbi:AraC family transcriptional regulator [Agitococcus lubricus]|uniref:AraC family transcriptional regulator n=1 Tax=Agitococcus lubricus TaxID=1077255 RepID=A0A2T5J452_9GAMM|nr:AraC family transcriptional regulator [Agitococcus lubricus]PTQ91395.1 AraC family transcriptional regulator [Agitococcus lubricus]
MKHDLDPNKAVVPIAYPRLLLDIMAERGFSRHVVLAGSNLQESLFDQPEQRISPAQFLFIVLNSFYLSKDASLGYEMGLRTPVTSHGFLGYGVMSCANLEEAIKLAQRFVRLRTVLMRFHYFIEGDEAVVEATANYPVGLLRQFVFESLLLSLARAGSFITGNSLYDGKIYFDFPEPDYYAHIKDRVPPVYFNRPANQLRFPKHYLQQALIMADPVAAKLAAEQCERELALMDMSHDIPSQVRALLNHQQGHYPNLEQVAERLCVSSRTLKRRLQEYGLGFQHLLDEARKRDAIQLIQTTPLTIEQIAQRLGYTDPANFTRAFKKWTGETPSNFRLRT